MIKLLTSVFFILLFNLADARDYYVDASSKGSDLTGDGTLAKPYKTIQKAASLAGPGETIFIRQGIYRETITPAKSGNASSPIVFI